MSQQLDRETLARVLWTEDVESLSFSELLGLIEDEPKHRPVDFIFDANQLFSPVSCCGSRV